MEVECPSCGAVFRIPETVKTYTCPYCGLVFGEKEEQNHYYFPIMREEPYSILLNFLRRQFGAPSDIAASSTLSKRELHYIPVYFFYLYGRANAVCGKRGMTRAEEGLYKGFVALSRFQELLKDYPFPIRGRRFFRPEIMKMGRYHRPEFDEEEARKRASKTLENMIYSELRKQCRRPMNIRWEENRVEYRGLIHYPIYYLEYLYGGQGYSAYVDGSDGKIILAEHPLKLGTRAIQAAVSGGLITSSLILGIPISYLAGSPLPLVFALIGAIASSIPLLRRTVSRKVKSSELKVIKGESESFQSYLRRLPI